MIIAIQRVRHHNPQATVLTIKEALNNSSMNYQNTNKIKCDFILFFIINGLSATENGNTSMCCGNSELIRVPLMKAIVWLCLFLKLDNNQCPCVAYVISSK